MVHKYVFLIDLNGIFSLQLNFLKIRFGIWDVVLKSQTPNILIYDGTLIVNLFLNFFPPLTGLKMHV